MPLSRYRLLLVLLLLPLSGFGQKEGDTWFFGQGVLMDFAQGSPVATASGVIASPEGSSSLCDSAGNLLFYTNGWQLRNRFHTAVPGWPMNSTPFVVSQSIVQGSLLLPVNDSLVFCFNLSTGNYAIGGYYVKIDPRANSDTGQVMTGPILFSDSLYQHMGAVRHADGESWWVILHKTISDVFVKLHIATDGTVTRYDQQIGSVFVHPGIYFTTPLVFNQQGNRFALGVSLTRLEIFDFDRCTGEITFFNYLEKPYFAEVPYYGLSFSPNGKLLYTSDGYFGPIGDSLGVPTKLFQYNLDSANLLGSEFLVHSTPPPCEPWWQGAFCRRAFGAHKLGPDGKIYIGQANGDSNFGYGDSLGVIHNPNELGANCNFQLHVVPLPTGTGSAAFPNIPNYRLGPLVAQVAEGGPNRLLCPGDSVMIGTPDTSANVVFSWSPSAGLSDPSAAQPMASPAVSTTYYLMVEDTTVHASCSTTLDSVRVTVINPQSYGIPSANAGRDTLVCANAQVQLGVADTSGGAWTYQWSPPTGLNNAQIAQPIASTSVSQIYLLSVSRPEVAGTCMTVRDSVSIQVYDPGILPQSAAGDNAVICTGDSTVLGEPAQGGFAYSWFPPSNLSNPQSPRPIAWPDATISYVLQVNDPIVTGPCGEKRDTVTITVEQPFSHDAPSDVTFCPGECITIGVAPQPGLDYAWSPLTGLESPTASLTKARPSITTVYTLAITDPNRQSANCRTQTFSVNATADNCNFPGFLWPNGDGIAETLDFGDYDGPLSMEVYDAQGRLVYRSAEYRNDWDGDGISPGVYLYRLTVGGECGFVRAGKLVLLR